MSESKEGKGALGKVLGVLKGILTPNFIIVILALVCTQGGSGGYTSAMSLWGGNLLGLSATQLGSAATISFIAMMVIRPFAGKYVDSCGIRLQSVVGPLITAVSIVLMGFANSFLLFVIFRALYFATRSILGTTTMTVGTFCTDRRYMGMNAALQTFLPNLVSASFVLVAQNVFNATSESAPATVWYVIAAAYLVSMVPLLFLNLKDPKLLERQEAVKRAKAEKAAKKAQKKGSGFNFNEWLYLPSVPILCLNFFNGFVTFSVEIVAIILGLERGFDMVVYWLAGVAIFRAFGALIGGALADILNKAKFTVPPCLILSICSCLLVIFTSNPVLVTVAGALFGFSKNSMGPVLRKVAIAITPDERRGAMLSTSSLMTDISGMLGSLIAGILCDAFGTVPTLWITAAFPAFGLLVFALNYKKIAAAEAKTKKTPAAST